jgi:hypothetical protein
MTMAMMTTLAARMTKVIPVSREDEWHKSAAT